MVLFLPCPSFPSSSLFSLSAFLPLSCCLLILISLLHNLFFYSLSPVPLHCLLLGMHHAYPNSCLLKRMATILVRKRSGGEWDCLSGHLLTQPQIFQRSLDSCSASTLNPHWFWVGFRGLNPFESLVPGQQHCPSPIAATSQDPPMWSHKTEAINDRSGQCTWPLFTVLTSPAS